MADEEPVDPRALYREKCQPKVKGVFDLYKACESRIQGKKDLECSGTYFDYMKAMDKCAAAQIFHTLK